jgi:formylglycine-generating enzyme required for sulfatase activity
VKVYISSTFRDLLNYRQRVRDALAELGQSGIAMEAYVAEGKRTVHKCLSDVRECDIYIGLFAWRYGWIPDELNPGQLSITHLEYEQAAESKKQCFIFVLDDQEPWPPGFIDPDRSRITSLRNTASERHGAIPFRNPDDLKARVTSALWNWLRSQQSASEGLELKEYISSLSKQLEFVNLPLLVTKADGSQIERVRLDQIYTSLKAFDDNEDSLTVILRSRKTAIRGEAWSGKSILLQRIALQLAGDWKPGGRIPVLVRLEDPRLTLPDVSKVDYRDRWIPFLDRQLGLQDQKRTESLLRHEKFVFLFNDLHAITDSHARTAFLDAVHQLTEFSSHHRIVVTCRKEAWNSVEDSRLFEELGAIQPMRPELAMEYLKKWRGALGRPESASQYDTPLSESVSKIASNPGMAAILVLFGEQSCPQGFAALLDTITGKLIPDPPAAREWLSAAGFALQSGRAPEPDSSLSELVRLKTGLLVFDSDTLRFKDPVFQHFFAAKYIAGKQNLGELFAHIAKPDWFPTLVFTAELYARKKHSTQFFEQLLATPRILDVKSLPEWAPRVAAATACLDAIELYKLDDALELVRQAHRTILPVFGETDLPTRKKIAEGFGVHELRDPRLDEASAWVVIPAGTFLRGSDEDDAWIQEQPKAKVFVSEFEIRRWPVTVGEYRAFFDAKGYDQDHWWSPNGLKWKQTALITAPEGWPFPCTNLPVTGISWWEAEAYCNWLNRSQAKTGYQLRMLTETQWEKAASGGNRGSFENWDKPRFPWGDWAENASTQLANFVETKLEVLPVGLFPSAHSKQPFGLWDMAGNVWEWCRDGFQPYVPEPGIEPVCEDDKYGRVIRGGASDSSALNLRVSCRFGRPPETRDKRTGFRVARVQLSQATTRRQR